MVSALPLGTLSWEPAEEVGGTEAVGNCQVIVDATGVGAPALKMVREARPGGWVRPVMITGGSTETEADGYTRVPKRDLIQGLQPG